MVARKVMAMGTRQKWVGILVMLAMLLFISAMPGYAERGGHGFRGHGFRGHGFRGHGFRGPHRFGGPRVFIRPHIVVPFRPFWGPYWRPYVSPYASPYAYPPVVAQPGPQVSAPPPP